MVIQKIKLMSGKKSADSKRVHFFGFRKNGQLMQVGRTFRTKANARKYGAKHFRR